MIDLKNNRYLIVEDEEENRDLLLRLLMDEYGISDENIREAENLNEAKDALEDFEPNIILLDLKIPLDKGYEPEMLNAYEFIQKAELYNFKEVNSHDKIKIIVISGSVKDKGVQKIISLDKNRVFDFFDKGEISSNFSKFTSEFKRKLEKASQFEGYDKSIDYSFVRRSLLKQLSKVNDGFWGRIDKQILQEFEKLNDKNVNEYNVSKLILLNCGEIVEDINFYFTNDTTSLDGIKYSYNEDSVIKRLTKLSGRKCIGKVFKPIEDFKYKNEGDKRIRRISQEYAHIAYKMSSQARHSKEDDENNNKWFADHNARFTKEDAAIAINLIVPLIQDYISYMKTK